MRVVKNGLLVILSLVVMFITPTIAKPINIKTEVLKAHNTVRVKHKQHPLAWSEDLAKISQQWADKLSKNCKVYHHQGDLPFGENLFQSSTPTSASKAVKAWADEEAFYNYKQNKCQAGKECGHYTQVVWKGTTDVGCGVQRCSNNTQIWVCGYFPAGNIIGARPY